MYSRKCAICFLDYQSAEKPDPSLCCCFCYDPFIDQANHIYQENITLAEDLYALTQRGAFKEVIEKLSEHDISGYKIGTFVLRLVVLRKNREGVNLLSLFSAANQLVPLLQERKELVLNYVMPLLLPDTKWLVIDLFQQCGLLTNQTILSILKRNKSEIAALSSATKLQLKTGLIQRELLCPEDERLYFSAAPPPVQPSSGAFFGSAAQADRRDRLHALLLKKREANLQKSSPPLLISSKPDDINFDDFDTEVAEQTCKAKKKKPRKKNKTKTPEILQIPSVDETKSEEVQHVEPASVEVPEAIIEVHEKPPLEAKPLISEQKKPKRQDVSLVGQLNRRTIKFWKRTAAQLVRQQLLRELIDFKKQLGSVDNSDSADKPRNVGGRVMNCQHALRIAPEITSVSCAKLDIQETKLSKYQEPFEEASTVACPQLMRYYLEAEEFPAHIRAILPFLEYLESNNCAPMLYGSCVTKALLNALRIPNTLTPGDVDLIFPESIKLADILSMSGGNFILTSNDPKNLYYDQYKGSFNDVSIDITVPKKGYVIHDPIDYAYFRAVKVPKESRLEFKLMQRDGRLFATQAELKTAVEGIMRGEFDITLPPIPSHRIIFRNFFMRVTKYIITWNRIFPQFESETMPNLRHFLDPAWQKSYFIELIKSTSPRGVPLAYLEMAELLLQNKDQLNHPLVEKIISSFLSVLLADNFQLRLLNSYKRALILNTDSNELSKEQIVLNVGKLLTYIQHYFSPPPSYAHFAEDPLSNLFSVKQLPSYAELTLGSAFQFSRHIAFNPLAPVFHCTSDEPSGNCSP